MYHERVFPQPRETGKVREAYVRMELKDYNRRRPPRERNERIFHEVSVMGRSLRAVAAEFKLSHTSIRRIVEKHEQWLGETIGREGTGDWLRRKGVAEHVHRERLKHIFHKCSEGLSRSFQDSYSVKSTKVDGKVVKEEGTRRQSPGNWRWMQLALQAESKRMQFEYDNGSLEPPKAEEMTEEEEGNWIASAFAQKVYMDRPPTEEELVDARTVHSRLEEERKALEEERKLLAIERAEAAKLKKESEAVLAKARADVGRASQPVAGEVPVDGGSIQAATTLTPALSHGEREAEARPAFTWRYAQFEDFNMSIVRNRELRRIREERERTGVVSYEIRTVGLPLKIRKGVFIVALPFPNTKQLEESYRAEYLRQEEEAKAAGKPWRDPFYMFDNFGQLLKKEE